jgi:hypothetical protein
MKTIKTILMILICQIGHTKTVELLTPITKDGLSRVEGRFVNDQQEVVKLSGTARVSNIKGDQKKIFRIVWTHIDGKQKDEPKYFDVPLMMTVSAKKIKRGTRLKFSEQELNSAMKNLKKVKSNKKLKDKYKTGRKVLTTVDGGTITTTSVVESGSTISSEVEGVNDSISTYGENYEHDKGYIRPGSQPDRKVGNNPYNKSTRRGSSKYRDSGYSAQQSHNGSYEPVFNTAHGSVESPTGTNKYSSSNIGVDSDGLFEFNDLPDKDKKVSKKKKTSIQQDDTRVEVVCDGCTPRVDEDNDRIIIQSKSVTYKNNEIIKESECTDSFTKYLIKKDYLCENCKDFVDLGNLKAWPTFEKHWINKDGVKTVISTQPEKDETLAFPIVKDKGDCEPYINLPTMQAFPQVELIYFDRVHSRKVAKACHKEDSAEGVNIQLTMEGCTPTHNFENKWSILKKKGVFELDGKQYTAFGCREEGEPIIHQYDTGVCSSSINLQEREAILMGRKYIMLNDTKVYLSDCEPIDSGHVLQETTQGCEGQFVHSQSEGRSYLKKRWYYNDHLDRQFVTTCQKSTEFIPHQIEVTGYRHNDGSKKSQQITTVYIEYGEDERDNLYTDYINPNAEPIPYTLISTTDEPTESFVYNDCYKISQTNKYRNYTRPDNTEYKEFIGIGSPLRSGNLCTITTETKDLYHHTHVWCTRGDAPYYEFDVHDPEQKKYPLARVQNLRGSVAYSSSKRVVSGEYIGCGMYVEHRCARYFEANTRTITHYPNGTDIIGDWIGTGRIRREGVYWASHTAYNKTPPLTRIYSFKEPI